MNQKGYSWMEAILTISIITIIFGTLLPIGSQITVNLYHKKLSMYAAESLYHGAIAYSSHGLMEGSRQFDHVTFYWAVGTDEICVYYDTTKEEMKKCISFNS